MVTYNTRSFQIQDSRLDGARTFLYRDFSIFRPPDSFALHRCCTAACPESMNNNQHCTIYHNPDRAQRVGCPSESHISRFVHRTYEAYTN